MGTITFTVLTDDQTTVNVTHTVAISDTDLDRFFTAMRATYAPGASNSQICSLWVTNNLARANAFVTTYEVSQIPAPNSVGYTVVS